MFRLQAFQSRVWSQNSDHAEFNWNWRKGLVETSQRSFVNRGLILWWSVLRSVDSLLLSSQFLNVLPNMQIVVLAYMAALSACLCTKRLQWSRAHRTAVLDLLPSWASPRKSGREQNAFACLYISRGLWTECGFSKPQSMVQTWGGWECNGERRQEICSWAERLRYVATWKPAKDVLEVMSSAVCIICSLRHPPVLPCSPTAHPPSRLNPREALLLPAVRGAGAGCVDYSASDPKSCWASGHDHHGSLLVGAASLQHPKHPSVSIPTHEMLQQTQWASAFAV